MTINILLIGTCRIHRPFIARRNGIVVDQVRSDVNLLTTHAGYVHTLPEILQYIDFAQTRITIPPEIAPYCFRKEPIATTPGNEFDNELEMQLREGLPVRAPGINFDEIDCFIIEVSTLSSIQEIDSGLFLHHNPNLASESASFSQLGWGEWPKHSKLKTRRIELGVAECANYLSQIQSRVPQSRIVVLGHLLSTEQANPVRAKVHNTLKAACQESGVAYVDTRHYVDAFGFNVAPTGLDIHHLSEYGELTLGRDLQILASDLIKLQKPNSTLAHANSNRHEWQVSSERLCTSDVTIAPLVNKMNNPSTIKPDIMSISNQPSMIIISGNVPDNIRKEIQAQVFLPCRVAEADEFFSLFESASTAFKQFVWLYSPPWNFSSSFNFEDDDLAIRHVEAWRKNAIYALNIKQKYPEKVVLVNTCQTSSAELLNQILPNFNFTVSSGDDLADSTARSARICASIHSEEWDLYETLELSSWLPSGTPHLRATLVGSDDFHSINLYKALHALDEVAIYRKSLSTLQDEVLSHKSLLLKKSKHLDNIEQELDNALSEIAHLRSIRQNLCDENAILLTRLHQVQQRICIAPQSAPPNTKQTCTSVKNYTSPQLIGAAERVKQQLSYRIGSVLVKNTKSISGFFSIPSSIYKEFRNYTLQVAKAAKEPKKPPLHTYSDYADAEKIKRHLSYRLGSAIVENSHDFLSIMKIPYALYIANKEYKEAKKK